MKAMQSTMVYLTSEQKTGLAKRAQQRKTKVAAEIRSAVDAYLAGVTAEELELLDAATRAAKLQLDGMVTELEGCLLYTSPSPRAVAG